MFINIAGEIVQWTNGGSDSSVDDKHRQEEQSVEGTAWKVGLARELPNCYHRSATPGEGGHVVPS